MPEVVNDGWSPQSPSGEGLAPKVAETHVSLLVFAGDRVYKLKKNVRTPFLDFSTTQLRRHACEREVELNRRLAPDVYLGVAGVTGPDGEPCDWLVVMRRMPPERRLARLARDHERDDCIQAVAEVVARFHRSATTGPEIDAEGTRDALQARWEANVEEVEPLSADLREPSLPGSIGRLAREYLAGRKPLFDQRIAGGRIRDGHGDLLADDVFCLDDGPRILDCLEFDDRLRYVDVLDDACFLAMDLERIGGRALGEDFLAAYRKASEEDHPASLGHHYRAYRAHVRAKIALIRHSQGDADALDEAAKLLRIALRHLQEGRVALVLVGGLPGTGKSTIARQLGRDRNWTVLRSDEIRKQIAGMPPSARAEAGYGQGIYSAEMTDATYRTLLDQAGALLEQGEPVICDASWSKAAWREAFRQLAERCRSPLIELRCEAPAAVTTGRIAARAAGGGDPSDATAEVADAMAPEFDPWPGAARVDTSGDLPQTVEHARQLISRALTE
ncbi:MAG TPA: AAA family ATPase [Actinomycetota bacterium]|nr:AAA family ATPase [Actinomycetota bacterium]